MAKVRQARAGKDYECGRCHNPIKKGDTYRWAKPGFRARVKKIRCMEPTCRFRRSELTTSNMGAAYAAQETAEDTIADATNLEDIKAAMSDVAEGFREVSEQYQEASDNWAGGQGHDEWQEWADQLEEAAGTCEDWEPEEDVSHDEDVVAEDGAEEIDDVDEDVLQAWKDDALETLSCVDIP